MRWAAVALGLLLTFNSLPAQAEWWDHTLPPRARNGRVMPSDWWEAVKRGCKQNNTDPFFIAAVIDIEGNGWNGGSLSSSFQGPCGFRKSLTWPNGRIPPEVMYTPVLQIEWATRLFRGDPAQRYKKYNPLWRKDNCLRDICRRSQVMESEAKIDLPKRRLFQ